MEEKKEPHYPASYEQLAETVREARKEVEWLENRLKSIPEDKNLAPRLRPGDDFRTRYANPPKTVLKQQYETEIGEIKRSTMVKVDNELAKDDSATRKQVRETALKHLSPNVIKDMKADEKDALASEKKRDLEKVQDHMDTQANDVRTDSPEAGKATDKAISWKELAKDQLGKAFAYDRTGKDITRQKDKSKDLDRD